MKNNRKHHSIALWAIFAIALLSHSCVKDRIDNERVGKDEALVTLSINAHSPSATRALDTDDGIKELQVILFKEGKYYATRTANIKAGLTKSTVSLPHGTFDMIFVANLSGTGIPSSFNLNEAKSSVINILVRTSNAKWGYTAGGTLPMASVEDAIKNMTIDGTTTNLGTIDLYRMTARVNVVVSNSIPKSKFELVSVKVVNSALSGNLLPKFSGSEYVLNPGSNQTLNHSDLIYSGDTEINSANNSCENTIYLNERQNHISNTPVAKPVFLIVGGKYDGGATTYYRVDFKDNSPEKWYDVMRNHSYTFSINTVSGPGVSETEAVDYTGGNLMVNVIPWNDALGDVHFDGSKYIGFSKRDLDLPSTASSDKVEITTNIPWASIIINGLGTATTETSTTKTWKSGEEFTITFTKGSAETHTINVAAIKNDATNPRSLNFSVAAFAVQAAITVKQQAYDASFLYITPTEQLIQLNGEARGSGKRYEVKVESGLPYKISVAGTAVASNKVYAANTGTVTISNTAEQLAGSKSFWLETTLLVNGGDPRISTLKIAQEGTNAKTVTYTILQIAPNLKVTSDFATVAKGGGVIKFTVTSNLAGWKASITSPSGEPDLNGAVLSTESGNDNGMVVLTLKPNTFSKDITYKVRFESEADPNVYQDFTITHKDKSVLPTAGGCAGTAVAVPAGKGFTYVGAFWRHDQIGERIIRIPVDASTAGDWTASVAWLGGSFGLNDILLSTSASSDGNLYTPTAKILNSANDASYVVSDGKPMISGNAPLGGYITFRIGLKTKLASETTAPRYAVLELKYNNNSKVQYLHLRQGQADDYLMRIEDPSTSTSFPYSTRPSAVKISPYNLTAATLNKTVDPKCGSFTDFPTQAGAMWQWYNKVNPRVAYDAFSTLTIDRNDVIAGFWNNTTHETCPTGYHRPSDGYVDSYANNQVPGSETRQSLMLVPASSIADVSNSIHGYYADGFFDRLNIVNGVGLTMPGNMSSVSISNGQIAHVGRLFINPYTRASVFFPLSGQRQQGVPQSVGFSGYYSTKSLKTFAPSFGDAPFILFLSATAVQGFGNNSTENNGMSIRCVADN